MLAASFGLTEAVALTGAITGIAGLSLSILETIHRVQLGKVRLKVKPGIYFSAGTGPEGDQLIIRSHSDSAKLQRVIDRGRILGISVEVVNLSAFDVTVNEVGCGKNAEKETRQIMLQPMRYPDAATLPAKISPRESAVLYFPLVSSKTNYRDHGGTVYVETACGEYIYKESRSVAAFNEWLAKLPS